MNRKITFSLGKKSTLLIILMAVTLIVSGTLFSYRSYQNAMEQHLISTGQNLAKTAANFIDGDKLDYYVQTLEEDAEYENTLHLMRILKRDNEVLYLYVVKPTEAGTYYVYDTDESEDRCELGYFEEWYDDFQPSSQNFINGNIIDPIISNESFGWLLSVYEPIKGSDGTVKGYVGADFSMDGIISDEREFLIRLILLLTMIAAGFTILYLYLINRAVISPINKMSKAANAYLAEDVSTGADEDFGVSIRDLSVHSNDEVGKLAEALQSMERKITEYIHNLDIATKRAETDEFTGLDNRNTFHNKVEYFIKSGMEETQLDAFVIIDIDHFKKINDTYGHIAGDMVLKQCADALKSIFRGTDIVSRFGGDEFAVFCRGIGSESVAEEKVKQIDILLGQIRPAENAEPITVSSGISFFPKDGKTYMELYQKADSALYIAKDQGRNQYIIYSDEK